MAVAMVHDVVDSIEREDDKRQVKLLLTSLHLYNPDRWVDMFRSNINVPGVTPKEKDDAIRAMQKLSGIPWKKLYSMLHKQGLVHGCMGPICFPWLTIVQMCIPGNEDAVLDTHSRSGTEAEIVGPVLAQDVQLVAEEPGHDGDGHAHGQFGDIPSVLDIGKDPSPDSSVSFFTVSI